MLPKFLDADHHIAEPPDFYTGRFAKKFAALEPKFMPDHPQGAGWSWDGGKTVRPLAGVTGVGSGDPRHIGAPLRLHEMDAGIYDAKARVEVMDIDGAQAALVFSSSVPPAYYNFATDDDFYIECARVFNDAAMDWAKAGDPKRLIPAAQLPMCSAEAALGELERAVLMGYKHYQFNMYPSGGSVPTPADEPFWARVQELGVVTSIHSFRGGRLPKTPPPLMTAVNSSSRTAMSVGTQSGARAGGQVLTAANRGAALGSTVPLAAFVFSGVLERYPDLKVAFVEKSLGWLPYMAEAMDATWLRMRWLGESRLKNKPSESLYKIYQSFDREWFGVKYRHAHVGAGKVMFGTDYPHIGTFYPHSRFYLELVLQGVPAAEQEQMLWSNGARLYGLN